MIRVAIPNHKKVEDGQNTYTVFCLEVLDCSSGKMTHIEKRYSEFEAIHKQVKKIPGMRIPEFPPKKVMKWNSKVLEQRRLGLQTYVQGVLQGDRLSKSMLNFLEISLPDCQSEESFEQSNENIPSHHPLLSFTADAFLQENNRSSLPDIIVQGVHMGLYATNRDDYLLG
ncbi:sorting nexin-24-like [Mytilus galloprovincialis]|uniref:sorting nexin-24-like n=1 Tax=Mytilus galloprovincialis TaxID=29158 RepID=UPI003F7C0B69